MLPILCIKAPFQLILETLHEAQNFSYIRAGPVLDRRL